MRGIEHTLSWTHAGFLSSSGVLGILWLVGIGVGSSLCFDMERWTALVGSADAVCATRWGWHGIAFCFIAGNESVCATR